MAHLYIRFPNRKQPVKIVRLTPAEVKANMDFYALGKPTPRKVAPRRARQ